ncbi:MAG: hypothetical protein ABIJ57_03685, partial [Pseudomonadota bacterium]
MSEKAERDSGTERAAEISALAAVSEKLAEGQSVVRDAEGRFEEVTLSSERASELAQLAAKRKGEKHSEAARRFAEYLQGILPEGSEPVIEQLSELIVASS